MDAQKLLEQLLESGKKLAQQSIDGSGALLEKGKDLAAQGFEYAEGQLPPAGPERDALMKKVGVGAAASGILALLVGTKSGRKAIAPIAKVGSVAALGGLAYKMYTEWQKSQGSQPRATDVSRLDGEAANDRSLNLIRAMISAAKSDGTIDANENKLITQQLQDSQLNESAASFLMNELQQVADPKRIADAISSNEEAVEVYLASLMVTGAQSEAERSYLAALSKALKLDPLLAGQLEREVLPNPG